MKTGIIIMSRIPEPGYTKTRLLGKLSPNECAVFHRACLRDICRVVRNTGITAYLYYTGSALEEGDPGGHGAGFEQWQLAPEDYPYFIMRRQKGLQLGERMLNAAGEVLPDHDAVIFLGSDMPCLTPALLQESINRLHTNDLVIGPAEDGGYYLLAIKNVHKALFQDIPWSTAGVLDATLQAAAQGGLIYSLLPVHSDIDTWDDLISFSDQGLIHKEYTGLDSYKYAAYLIEKSGLQKGAQ
ncbi:MAG: TIGR04282 family arsenosugar biosynthesis glycosyltransferase [Syntrophomonas sp.]